jgi:uncharacterized repeat protein (TIGR01451 family)
MLSFALRRRSMMILALMMFVLVVPATRARAACVETCTADVGIAQTDSPDPVTAGNRVVYAVAVTNSGPDPASSLNLSDTLSAGTIVSASGSGWTCTVNSSTSASCFRSSLANGALSTINVVVTAPAFPVFADCFSNLSATRTSAATSGDGICNTTSVSTDGSFDPNSGNDSWSENTDVSDPTSGTGTGAVSRHDGGSVSVGPVNGTSFVVTFPPTSGSGFFTYTIVETTGSFCNGPCSGEVINLQTLPSGYAEDNPIVVTTIFNPQQTSPGHPLNTYLRKSGKTTKLKTCQEGPLPEILPIVGELLEVAPPCVESQTWSGGVQTIETWLKSGDPFIGHGIL